jgi:hypothetical protein
MNGQFTTEIGRMRSEEMVNRGLQYQKAELMKRAQEQDRPIVRRKVAHRRILVTAALSALFLSVLSTAAFAYPLNPTGGQISRAGHVVSDVTSQPQVTSSTDPFTWIALAVVACAVLAAFALASGQRKVAHS